MRSQFADRSEEVAHYQYGQERRTGHHAGIKGDDQGLLTKTHPTANAQTGAETLGGCQNDSGETSVKQQHHEDETI